MSKRFSLGSLKFTECILYRCDVYTGMKEVLTLELKGIKVYVIQVSREGDFLLLVEKNGLLTTQSGVQVKAIFGKSCEPSMYEIS